MDVTADGLVCSSDDPTRIASVFAENGAAVVRSAIPVEKLERLHAVVALLIRRRLDALGQDADIGGDIDLGYRRLTALDPRYGHELIRVVRENEAFFDVVLSPEIRRLAAGLIPDAMLHFVPDTCMMRIDSITDEDRAFDWHYDHSYVAMSERMVVCWVPLTPVNPDMGCLKIVPGTHHERWRIRLRREFEGKAFSGPKRIELADFSFNELESRAVELPAMRPGDVGLLHANVLHRSGTNRSPHARWICNPRFGDLLDPAMVGRGWKMSRPGNPYVFAEIHPDRVVEG